MRIEAPSADFLAWIDASVWRKVWPIFRCQSGRSEGERERGGGTGVGLIELSALTVSRWSVNVSQLSDLFCMSVPLASRNFKKKGEENGRHGVSPLRSSDTCFCFMSRRLVHHKSMLLGAKCNLPEQWLLVPYLYIFLYCFLPPRFLYFSLFPYVSPSSCLLTSLSRCFSFSISFIFPFIFSLCLSMLAFRIAFSLYPSFAVFFLLYLFSFFLSFPSFFNAFFLIAVSLLYLNVAYVSSPPFLPFFPSFSYLFLSDIPAFLFLFPSTVPSFLLPIFVSLSFYPQYFIAIQCQIIYKHLESEIHVRNTWYKNSFWTSL